MHAKTMIIIVKLFRDVTGQLSIVIAPQPPQSMDHTVLLQANRDMPLHWGGFRNTVPCLDIKTPITRHALPGVFEEQQLL